MKFKTTATDHGSLKQHTKWVIKQRNIKWGYTCTKKDRQHVYSAALFSHIPLNLVMCSLTVNFLEFHQTANVNRQTTAVVRILLQHTETQHEHNVISAQIKPD